MNLTSLLLIPVVSAGLLVSAPTVPPAETKEQLRAYLAQLNAGIEATAEAPAPIATPAAPALATSRLQAASGLHSAARGLSDKADWQQRFPRYTKR